MLFPFYKLTPHVVQMFQFFLSHNLVIYKDFDLKSIKKDTPGAYIFRPQECPF